MSSSLFILLLVLLIISTAIIKKKNAYQLFIEGAKEGTEFALDLFPFLFTFVLATTMLGSCGILDNVNLHINVKNVIFPFDLLLQAIMRPISSSASLTMMVEIFNKYGVDSPAGVISSFIQNSTDTTLYVITFYFGSIKIMKTKYALKAGLLVDLLNFLIAILTALLYFKIM